MNPPPVCDRMSCYHGTNAEVNASRTEHGCVPAWRVELFHLYGECYGDPRRCSLHCTDPRNIALYDPIVVAIYAEGGK